MKLIGYIKPYNPATFSIPIYSDGKEKYYHRLDMRFNIIEFNHAEFEQTECIDHLLEESFEINDLGAIVFIDKELNPYIGRVNKISNQVAKILKSYGEDYKDTLSEIESFVTDSFGDNILEPRPMSLRKYILERLWVSPYGIRRRRRNFWEKKNILIINDDAKFANRILGSQVVHNYPNISSLRDYRGVSEYLKNKDIDLILFDFKLENEKEFINLVIHHFKDQHVPIIMISSVNKGVEISVYKNSYPRYLISSSEQREDILDKIQRIIENS